MTLLNLALLVAAEEKKALLQDWSAGQITLVCSIPALLFCVYVAWDDHRQAKRQHH